ncbi:hypothetical protein EIJ81_00455 (plasmid) [Aliivibrio salmonicida]|uniref:hypothetical protein n=1 Tax=Aliivibrio salmonicida TaxID=40269 RepID=UPI000F6EA2E2|nr:hypothetical protein [Aliivibrio salmonicida]AZL83370.1 hypothetical protein EIJ81_00455 [Aliivibrio salmonicida]
MKIVPMASIANTLMLFLFAITHSVSVMAALNPGTKFILTQDAANEIMMYHDGVINNLDGSTSYLGCGSDKKIAHIQTSRSALNHLKEKAYISSTENMTNQMTNEIRKVKKIRLNKLIIIDEAYFTNNKTPNYCQIAILLITEQYE